MRSQVDGLTLLALDEMQVRHGSYAELADVIRRQFTEPTDTLAELFGRIVFNVLVGNTDDHPRNHAAFWGGAHATLTPAHDICPQPRTGGEAAQAMAIGRHDQRLSRLNVCVDAADTYLLHTRQARDIVDRLTTVVHDQWDDACDQVGLTEAHRQMLWRRAVCNPYAFNR